MNFESFLMEYLLTLFKNGVSGCEEPAWLLSLVHRIYEFPNFGIRYIRIITNLIATTGIRFSEWCDSNQLELTSYICNNRSTRVTLACICDTFTTYNTIWIWELLIKHCNQDVYLCKEMWKCFLKVVCIRFSLAFESKLFSIHLYYRNYLSCPFQKRPLFHPQKAT